MSVRTGTTIRCDRSCCNSYEFASTREEAEQLVKERGWSRTEDGRDFTQAVPARVLSTDAVLNRRFAIAGLSGGGPYALACAHEMPQPVAWRRAQQHRLAGQFADRQAVDRVVVERDDVRGQAVAWRRP